jgi:hypothetical protein
VYALLGSATTPTTKANVDTSVLKPLNLQVSAVDFAPRSLLHLDFLPAPQPTCPQQAAQTVAYWHAWSAQQLRSKPLNVLVWHGTWTRTTTEAQAGGPMGELGLFTSTMLALTAMAAKVTFLAHPQGEAAMRDAMEHYDEYDIILIDTYSAEILERGGHLRNPDVLCRIRALDYWGTPDRQNSWKLPNLRQYLVPFACTLDQSTPNTLLLMHRFKNLKPGQTEDFHPTPSMRSRDAADREADESFDAHRLKWSDARKGWPADSSFDPVANLHPPGSWDLVPGARDNEGHAVGDAFRATSSTSEELAARFQRGELAFPKVYAKRFQILVWGKEPKYFVGLSKLLRALAEVVPLVTIVRKEGEKHFPDVSDLPKTADGFPRIRHLGIQTQSEMARVQSESALLMGVGDPIFSFTPLEALQVGTPYLNPNFLPPKSYWMNGDCVITSQHPYAERLGAPQTWNFNIGDLEATKLVVRTALKWIKETQERLGGIPSLYPRELQYPNLVRRLNENFRTDYCEETGRNATPAHKQH